MALIKCGECKREISDKALSCPGCGAPISGIEIGPGKINIQTVQETSKQLKTHIIISVALIVFGLVGCIGGDGDPETIQTSTWSFMIGVGWYIIARLRIWWHHS